MNEGVVPPYSQEAEQGCIGAVIINPDNLLECDLMPDDFFLGVHKVVWEAMVKCHEANIAIDVVTIIDRLEQMGKLEEIGGAAKVVSFTTVEHMSFNFSYYVEIVKRYSWKRKCLGEINKVAQAIFDDGCDEKKFGEVLDRSTDAMLTGRTKETTKHFSEVLTQVYDEVMENVKAPKQVWGMETGLVDLDTLLGGLHLGEIFDISGPPGVGKSRLALAFAIGLAKNGFPGAIYSLEMKDLATGYRGLSAWAEIATRKLHTGELTDDEIVKFTQSYGDMSNLPLYISDQSQTVQSLRADLKKLQKRHGIMWFVLDYMMLLDGYENLDETPRSAALSRGIKRIVSGTPGFHGIVLHTVTKTGMEGQPKIADMRGSGQVTHDADLVAFVTENNIDQSILRLTFEKTRDVSNGKRTLEFYAHTGYPKISSVMTRKVSLNEL